jgi:hypothetical protein
LSERIRSALLTLTILLLIFHFSHRDPAPVVTQVDYCEINYRAAVRDMLGNWHTGWARGFGLCSLLDRFEYL